MTKYKLTINDVKSLAETNEVQYLTTSKLYYKEYAYNMTLRHISLWHHSFRTSSESDIRDIKNLHYHFTVLYKNFTQLLDKKGISYRTRHEVNYNIYFSDPSVFKLAVKILKENIVEINGPANQEHLTTMQNNRKVVVRERLWYKKYKFKISYRGTSDFQNNIVPSILEFKKTLTNDEIKLSNNIYRIIDNPPGSRSNTGNLSFSNRFVYSTFVQPWHMCTVYLDCEDNYILYKMMVGGESETELEIMLLDDLKTDK